MPLSVNLLLLTHCHFKFNVCVCYGMMCVVCMKC